MLYILKNKKPVLEPDIAKWAEWFGNTMTTGERKVALTPLDGCEISTVFLGIDYGGQLWETMVFGDEPYYQRRCSGSWEQAEAMHAEVVAFVKSKTSKKIPDEKDETD